MHTRHPCLHRVGKQREQCASHCACTPNTPLRSREGREGAGQTRPLVHKRKDKVPGLSALSIPNDTPSEWRKAREKKERHEGRGGSASEARLALKLAGGGHHGERPAAQPCLGAVGLRPHPLQHPVGPAIVVDHLQSFGPTTAQRLSVLWSSAPAGRPLSPAFWFWINHLRQ